MAQDTWKGGKPNVMDLWWLILVLLTAIGSEDLLMSERQPFPLSWSWRLDTLQFDTSHGAFRQSWSLLQVLENQLATGSADLLPTVRSGVVRQPSSIGDTLNHLKEYWKIVSLWPSFRRRLERFWTISYLLVRKLGLSSKILVRKRMSSWWKNCQQI